MLKINKINIYSQTKSKRTFVGRLFRDDDQYYFEYEKAYKNSKNAVPLGPELPLWKDRFSSKKMFSIFMDRIPSKNNPAYRDYCKEWGIAEDEDDLFILLTTIGRRGPSTFIFETDFENTYTPNELVQFRNRLNLTQSEFEMLFNISHMTLNRLEKGTLKKSDFYMTYFALFDKVPQALQWILKKRGQVLHDEKLDHLKKLCDL